MRVRKHFHAGAVDPFVGQPIGDGVTHEHLLWDNDEDPDQPTHTHDERRFGLAPIYPLPPEEAATP